MSCIGNRTYLLQDEDGQIEGHSISPVSIIRALAPNMLICAIRAASIMCSATDGEALEAFPAHHPFGRYYSGVEPSHALAHVGKIAGDLPPEHLLVMNMCGRGDKDVFAVAEHLM